MDAQVLATLEAALCALPSKAAEDGAKPRHHILAVSGGPDSIALLHAVSMHAARLGALGHLFHVVTVDHALRPEAAEEAAGVGRLASALGLAHRIMRWEGEKPTGNLQANARAARYELLVAAAEEIGAISVMTAHHQDDQIETHLLAAARNAGPRGLAGMRTIRALRPGLWLLRPFLSVPGARLTAMATKAGLPILEDPSNRDRRYDRVRIRGELAATTFDRAALLGDIAFCALARDAADSAFAAALERLRSEDALGVFEDGAVRVDAPAHAALDPDVRLHLLSRLVAAVGGRDHPPSWRALLRLDAQLCSNAKGGGGATLGGVSVRLGARHLFHREFGRAGPAELHVPAQAGRLLFDGRLSINLPFPTPAPLILATSGRRIVPLGVLGIGNPRERVAPVLLDPDGRLVAAAEVVLHKLAPGTAPLEMREEVSWRLSRDLPGSQNLCR